MPENIEKIISLIFETRRMLHEQKEPNSGKNCSFLHLIALGFVEKNKPLMKDMAGFLGVAPPSATSLVDTLVKSELVFREADKNDRRTVKICISKKGEKFLEAHKKKMSEKMRENLSRLSQSEQAQLKKILEKITKQ